MKTELYFKFIGVVMDMIKAPQSQGKVKALGVKLQTIGLNMLVVASDDVVEKFIKWRALSMLDNPAETVMEAFGDVIFAIRRELNAETTRSASDVMEILF